MTRERRLTVTLIGILAAVMVIGAGIAFGIGRAQHVVGEGSTGDGTTSRESTTSGSHADVVTSPAPGGVDVGLSAEAQSSPHAAAVQNLLSRYFAAINSHDFAAWSQTVTPAQSAGVDQQSWEQAYRSTEDSDIYVSDITDEAPMSVRIQFVSKQDPALAPTSLPVECINWDVIYSLTMVGDGLRVGTSTRDPYLVACR